MQPQAKSRAAKGKLTGEVDVPKARKLEKLATKTLAKENQFEFLGEHQPRHEGVWSFNYHTVNQL